MTVPQWLADLFQLVLILLPAALWIAFCLWGIHWKKMWFTLKEGGWIPLTLLLVLVAMIWSLAAPRELPVFGFFSLPNFWWQLGVAMLVACVGLFAGWVQENYGWYPQEVPVEPPPDAHAHGHHHGHAPDNHDTPALD